MKITRFFRLFFLFFLCDVPDNLAQIAPRLPAADTIYFYKILNNDTTKRILEKRFFYLYDKQGHLREILLEKRQENAWQYQKRMIFAYNAINRLQMIRYEIWDSTARDWLKYKKRMFGYNIRHLPIEYTDEQWNDTNKTYRAFRKTTFTYDKKNRPYQAVFKVFKQEKWIDSIRKTLIYDTSGKVVAVEQRRNSKDTWFSQFYWEYKYENNIIKEIIQKDAKDEKNLEALSKSVFFYNTDGLYVGRQEQDFVGYKKPFKERAGMKAWFSAKKNQWTYSFYQIENNKKIVKEQWVLCPTSERVRTLLPNFPFSLELEW